MVKEVFIGSTAQDLGTYRLEVQDALLRRAEIAAFLSEDWTDGYGKTVEKCCEKLKAADGYLGIFAYWYGSLPPGCTKSITHMEFHWAKEKWAQSKNPRIAVFRPGRRHRTGISQELCQAEKELKAAAEALLKEKPSRYCNKHTRLLKIFLDEVDSPNDWRTTQWFESVKDLRELAITTCLKWKGRLFELARQHSEEGGTFPAERQVTAIDLGLLGRGRHFAVVDNVISQLTDPAVPGVAMLIHGNVDSGQWEFLDQLMAQKALRRGRLPQRGRLPLDRYEQETLIAWVGERIGDPGSAGPIDSLESLASAIHTSLQQQQVVLILDQIWRYDGGIGRFQKAFWAPLYARLVRLRAQKPTRHRLIMFVVDYTGHDDNLGDTAAVFEPDQDEFDFSRLVLLPMLSAIKKSDVRSWLAKLEVADEPLGRCEEIVKSVLMNRAGEADGTPRRVFDRLRRESLWPEDE